MNRLACQSVLFLEEFLRVQKNLRSELHVSGLVHAMNVTKGSGHGETVADLGKNLIGLIDFLRLRIEAGAVDIGVVHAIFLATGYPKLDLNGHAELIHSLEIIPAGLQVVFDWLFRKVKHVGAVKRLAFPLMKLFSGIKHPVHPGQKLAGSVISVQNYGDVVSLGHGMNVHGSRDRSRHCGLLVFVGKAFTRIEHSSPIGKLDHYG